jgi:hypothetical protein
MVYGEMDGTYRKLGWMGITLFDDCINGVGYLFTGRSNI